MSRRDGPVLLAVDVGTSSVRASWYTPDGTATGVGAQRAFTWRSGPDGRMEIDFDALLGVCVGVIDDSLDALHGTGSEVAGVGIAAFWHGIGVVDGEGAPVSPLVGWGDARHSPTYERLRERFDAKEYHRSTGCLLRPWYPAARIGLFPRGPGRGGAWMSIGEYLAAAFHGARVTSISQASGTGLLDASTLRWHEGVLAASGVQTEHLCRVVDAEDVLLGLRDPWRERWPALADVPWLPALGDGACANVGLGAVGRRRLGVTVGTSAAVRVLWKSGDAPELPGHLWMYRLDRDHVVAGAALANAGSGIAWLRRLLRLPEGDALEPALAAAEEAEGGVAVLPDLRPERDGRYGDGRAVIAGLGPVTDAAALTVSWMRSVALRIADGAAGVERAVGTVDEIRAGGGAILQSPTWARLVGAALEREVHLPADAESTSRGLALVAASVLGLGPSIDEVAPPPGESIGPDPGSVRRMKAARERTRTLESRFGIAH